MTGVFQRMCRVLCGECGCAVHTFLFSSSGKVFSTEPTLQNDLRNFYVVLVGCAHAKVMRKCLDMCGAWLYCVHTKNVPVV